MEEQGKRGKTGALLLAGVFVLVIAGAAVLYNRMADRVQPDVEIAEQEGEAEEKRLLAPDFTVYNEDEEAVRLSDLLGTPVVLNFWASWCPPCKSEMPDFDKVWAELGDEVQFMMVDMVDGHRETMERGQAFIEESGYRFPVYYDLGQETANAYGVSSIPTTLFIDAEGYAVTGVIGAITEEKLRYGIELITAGE